MVVMKLGAGFGTWDLVRDLGLCAGFGTWHGTRLVVGIKVVVVTGIRGVLWVL